MLNKWVVEWSNEQSSFHIATLEVTLERNIRAFSMGTASQYVILAIADTMEEAEELQSEFEKFNSSKRLG